MIVIGAFGTNKALQNLINIKDNLNSILSEKESCSKSLSSIKASSKVLQLEPCLSGHTYLYTHYYCFKSHISQFSG